MQNYAIHFGFKSVLLGIHFCDDFINIRNCDPILYCKFFFNKIIVNNSSLLEAVIFLFPLFEEVSN